DRPHRGDDDDRHLGPERLELRQEIQSVLLTQPQIQEGDLDWHAPDGRDRLFALRGPEHAPALALEQHAERISHGGIVVDNQKAWRRGHAQVLTARSRASRPAAESAWSAAAGAAMGRGTVNVVPPAGRDPA